MLSHIILSTGALPLRCCPLKDLGYTAEPGSDVPQLQPSLPDPLLLFSTFSNVDSTFVQCTDTDTSSRDLSHEVDSDCFCAVNRYREYFEDVPQIYSSMKHPLEVLLQDTE